MVKKQRISQRQGEFFPRFFALYYFLSKRIFKKFHF